MATLEREWNQLAERAAAGRRLSAAEIERLFSTDVDLHLLGQWANEQRRRRHGHRAFYHRNAHLNPTNVCEYRCPLCAYSCDPTDSRAFVLSDEEILARAAAANAAGSSELHIVGGLHPAKGFDWYLRLLKMVHEAFPDLHLKAFTPVEIAWFAEQSGRSIESVLATLVEAGLGSMPGGGAEIFALEVRRQICPKKADAETWLSVHRMAHRLGLRSNATMLYGHLETLAQRAEHLIRLRELQDETGGFQAFVPLAFHPENTALSHLHGPTGLDDLRIIAIARLALDNFEHIKAYWISLGVATAQIALAYGADDLDGTVEDEKIHHEAGATSPASLSCGELQVLIREAGFEPVECDSLYRPVQR